MSLADLASRQGPPVRQCSTCYVLARLDDEQATALRGALANVAVEYGEVVDEVAKLGFDVEELKLRGSLSRHANGDCAAHERLRPRESR